MRAGRQRKTYCGQGTNQFTISQKEDDVYILNVMGRHTVRCCSHSDAIKAYEDYILIREALQQGRK